MTSRRPHWDDDLVDAVIDLQYHCVDCMEDDYPDIDQRDPDAVNKAWAHAIIAAVEDWQDARGDAIDGRSLAEAVFTVQRVRDEVDGDRIIPNVGDDMGNTAAYCAGYVDALRRVRRALNGDAE